MKTHRQKIIAAAFAVALAAVLSSVVYSHCQIPCGIYDDPARLAEIAEHIATIEKSMKQITELSADQKPNYNQLVRWVNNKDDHADELSRIVTYYFMAQRITPADKSDTKAYEDYVNKITLLHRMVVHSMKCKQTTDLADVEKLRTLLAEFKTIYLAEHEH
jgi:nickel superoxide dismutase